MDVLCYFMYTNSLFERNPPPDLVGGQGLAQRERLRLFGRLANRDGRFRLNKRFDFP